MVRAGLARKSRFCGPDRDYFGQHALKARPHLPTFSGILHGSLHSPEQGTQTFQSVRPAEFYSADCAVWVDYGSSGLKNPLGAQAAGPCSKIPKIAGWQLLAACAPQNQGIKSCARKR